MRIRRASLMLAVLLALPLALQAQPPGPRDPGAILHNPRALARYLRLTPEQVTATQKLAADLKATVDPLRQQEKQLRDALETAINAASPSPCDVGQAALNLRANHEKVKAALDDFDKKFSALLTPEQLARYEALKALVHGDEEGD